MSLSPDRLHFIRLNTTHNISGFSCGDSELDTFIQQEAQSYQDTLLGITHLVYYDKDLVGFVTLSMADIKRRDLPPEKRLSIKIESYPALLIGRLAVVDSMKRQGLGTLICKWCRGKALESTEWVGCRFLMTHSKPAVVSFYGRCGFVSLPNQSRRKYKTLIKRI